MADTTGGLVLNPNAQKLVDALRSGEYTQTTHQLRDGTDAMCCLGVACDVAAADTGGEWQRTAFCVGDESQSGFLPGAVQLWLGFWEKNGEYENNEGQCTSLSIMNDTGKTFPEIADIIESEPLGLFA